MKIRIETERRFENKTTLEIMEVEQGSFEDLEHFDVVLCAAVRMKAITPKGITLTYERGRWKK